MCNANAKTAKQKATNDMYELDITVSQAWKDGAALKFAYIAGQTALRDALRQQ